MRRQGWGWLAPGAMTMRVSHVNEAGLQHVPLPSGEEPSVLLADEVVDVVGGATLTARRAAFFVGYDFDGAFDGLCHVKGCILTLPMGVLIASFNSRSAFAHFGPRSIVQQGSAVRASVSSSRANCRIPL